MKYLKIVLKVFVILFGLFTLLNLIGTIYSYITPKLDIKSANSFYLYDKNNKLIFYGSGADKWVDLEDMGELIVKATVSAEDKNFFKHNGFNFFRIAKALYENLKAGEIIQGASTITQQYARNLFLDFDKTWERKWQEMWITFELETHYNKKEILEGYLNSINYGHGNYGIASASKYYFNKDVKELSLAEISILVGIPNSPSNYSPLVNYELAKEKQLIILTRLYENNYITEDELNKAYTEELTFYGKKEDYNLTTFAYFKDAVIEELKSKTSIPTNYLETGGLKIYTTLDLEAQEALEVGIESNLVNDDIQVSKILMDVNNGAILGLVGGTNYEKSTYNRVTSSIRQPGSTVKPFLYYKAIENNFTASSTFYSGLTTFNFENQSSYKPRNSGNIYANKDISLAAAIAYSDNIYAVKTHLFLGEEQLKDILKEVGITSKVEATPSLALGTYEVNIIELASAYSVLANSGYKVKPHIITKVENNSGSTLYIFEDKKEKILNSNITFIISELLTGSYDNSLIDYTYPTCINMLSSITNKYALKSGSTNTDAWVIGYTPEYVLATWAGYDDNSSIENSVVSSNKNSWIKSMEYYLKNKKSTWYEMPSDVVGVLANPITGVPATENDNNKKILYYLKDTEPTNDY